MARLRNLSARAWWIWKPAFASPAMRRYWSKNWRGKRADSPPFSEKAAGSHAAEPDENLAAYDSCVPSSSHSFSVSAPAARVVSFEEARHLVEQHAAGVCPGEVETVDLLAGLGRVLAKEIVADRDFPPFDRATRDGYAVRAADLAEIPARLEVVGEAKAGCWAGPGE